MTPANARLFRVIVPVANIARAAAFYGHILADPGERISPGRHYFDCEGVILACYSPREDGDGYDATPNSEHVYFAVPDLDSVYARVREAGAPWTDAPQRREWGEHSFYARDPFGNPLCFVLADTLFTGG